ncbi:KH domain-containing protein [Trichostrongylus colubriformis]|uniref:KH domain-containing protein n=1 Tax=Trichostrongylus colubriformis TaxID=6319 RepID=A0AAN8F242_TRICO
MEPRLAAGRQATERVELTRQGIGRATADSAAALADQLVLEFLVMELTEPPAAQLAKTAGDGAQLQFISGMFDRNPILERLAASVVIQLLGPAMQRNSLHQHEEFDESAIPVENSQHLRLLYQIREVLQRRNSLHQNVYTGTQMETSPRSVLSSVPQPATILQPDYNSSTNACPRHCENCGSNQQLSYLTQLMQNMRIGQNLNNLVSQHETESGLFKASPPTAATTQMPSQEAPTVRTSKITAPVKDKKYFRGVKCSYIGRLIGPNGITIRELQLETRCHIAVRGRGSIKDSKLFRKMRHKPGFGHLREDTHVLVEAKGTSRVECRTLIEKAKKRIADMFTPEFDSLKREQLIHLAMLNGTYRQSLPSPKSST